MDEEEGEKKLAGSPEGLGRHVENGVSDEALRKLT